MSSPSAGSGVVCAWPCAEVLPAVCEDAGQGPVEVVLCHVLPVQHDAHAFGLHAGHAVIVVPKEGYAHHRHAVIHGLVDAVEATVAQEGPHVCMACKRNRSGDIWFVFLSFTFISFSFRLFRLNKKFQQFKGGVCKKKKI